MGWGEAEVVLRYYSRVREYDMFEISNRRGSHQRRFRE